ncbi:MAG: hypothetical protein GEU76_16345 [Alphaproteobacteria bacterium]|nr:hypothetical protein [Alphaproteobacteria bacterium]
MWASSGGAARARVSASRRVRVSMRPSGSRMRAPLGVAISTGGAKCVVVRRGAGLPPGMSLGMAAV